MKSRVDALEMLQESGERKQGGCHGEQHACGQQTTSAIGQEGQVEHRQGQAFVAQQWGQDDARQPPPVHALVSGESQQPQNHHVADQHLKGMLQACEREGELIGDDKAQEKEAGRADGLGMDFGVWRDGVPVAVQGGQRASGIHAQDRIGQQCVVEREGHDQGWPDHARRRGCVLVWVDAVVPGHQVIGQRKMDVRVIERKDQRPGIEPEREARDQQEDDQANRAGHAKWQL